MPTAINGRCSPRPPAQNPPDTAAKTGAMIASCFARIVEQRQQIEADPRIFAEAHDEQVEARDDVDELIAEPTRSVHVRRRHR
jgi:hypothetical protein